MKKLFCLFALLFIALGAFAQEVAPVINPSPEMGQFIIGLVASLMTKAPWFTTVLLVLGFFRLVFKPLFSFAKMITDATTTKTDDEIYNKVEKSKITKAVAWVLDYLFSLKLIK